jgi:plasmid stability protein
MTFRTRGDLRDRLAVAAAEHGRSLSEEVEQRLEQSFLYEDRLREMSERLKKAEEERSRAHQTLIAATDFVIGHFGGLPLPKSDAERAAAIQQVLKPELTKLEEKVERAERERAERLKSHEPEAIKGAIDAIEQKVGRALTESERSEFEPRIKEIWTELIEKELHEEDDTE